VSRHIEINPLTRVEGHYAIRLEVDEGRVVRAHSMGEMFRGFEVLLKGRSPLDAQQITQRICGICPISHGLASISAQEEVYRIQPPGNGRVLRNLILAANFLQSHIVHFYQLSLLDFIDIKAVLAYRGRDPALIDLKSWLGSQMDSGVVYPGAPFLPRYEGHYVWDTEINLGAIRHYLQAMEMRSLAHRMVAVFGGKAPHAATLVPGGLTEKVTAQKTAAFASMLDRLRHFIDTAYLPDLEAVCRAFPLYFQWGRGCGNFLAYGVFPENQSGSSMFLPGGVLRGSIPESLDTSKITEDVSHAMYSSSSIRHPLRGQTVPYPDKPQAYSWLKAPRYDGLVCEAGPLARLLVAYHGNHDQVKRPVDAFLEKMELTPADLVSVLGRHAARALECKILADRCAEWVRELKPGESTFTDFRIPRSGSGAGLTEAPRGALGHWIDIDDFKIRNYQCVVPSTWNCSPRDSGGAPGPVEQALAGTPVANRDHPIEAARVVRSFDPCLACAVH
jgi:ferredoxin hydrogenase large subunit/hydrogenase large subunit